MQVSEHLTAREDVTRGTVSTGGGPGSAQRIVQAVLRRQQGGPLQPRADQEGVGGFD